LPTKEKTEKLTTLKLGTLIHQDSVNRVKTQKLEFEKIFTTYIIDKVSEICAEILNVNMKKTNDSVEK